MDIAVAVIAAALIVLAGAWLAWGRGIAAARVGEAAARADADTARADATAARAESVEHRVQIRGHAVEVLAKQERITELGAVESERDSLAIDLAGLRATQTERDAAHARELANLHSSFAAVASKALDGAQVAFLERAEARFAEHKTLAEVGMAALFAPVTETLTRYQGELTKVEAARNEAYGGLKEQITALALGNARVSDEASKLVSALRSSGKTSGSWGEQQLRNTFDMAGLREGIDFVMQASVGGEEGTKRPDAIINLPGGRHLIVDSKCSLNDYKAGGEATDDETRRAAYRRHALAMRTHARGLSEKAYWKDFGSSADFVVMFIPGENFLSVALEHDLALLGWAFEQRILLAGPINLLAIAKIVAMNWRQEKQAEEWRAIGVLGAQLHAAVAKSAEHIGLVGKNLGQAVSAYNGLIGSLEDNVLPKARKFTELGVDEGKRPVAVLAPLDVLARTATAPELVAYRTRALPAASPAALAAE